MGRLRSLLGSLVIAAAALLGSLALCELVFRRLDGQPLWTLRLPSAAPAPRPWKALDPGIGGTPLPPDIDPTWIGVAPPPLANRRPVAPEIWKLVGTPIEGIKPFELFRIWNRRAVEQFGCRADRIFRKLPSPLLVFDPPEDREQPLYRYLPSRTLPGGLVTNQFGWRGPEIPLNKPPRTIRLAFAGASTTVGLYALPFSYPEYVTHWLNLWAARSGLDVRFDSINAGREGQSSQAIAAVILDEVLPLEPDLIVYYEGANQSLCTRRVPQASRPEPSSVSIVVQRITTATSPYLQVGRRLEQLRQRIEARDGHEVPKPSIDVRWWPPGLDETKPDITRADLPNEERAVLASLETARTGVAQSGAELALSSFAWLVYDGLRLDPLRHVVIHRHLNEQCWPYRYADLRRALDLHNRLLEQYAAHHGMPFIDVASAFPNDPDLFFDAFHLNNDGTRAHAWIVFRALVPLVRARIESGAWPRPDRVPSSEHPNIRPGRPFVVTCP